MQRTEPLTKSRSPRRNEWLVPGSQSSTSRESATRSRSLPARIVAARMSLLGANSNDVEFRLEVGAFFEVLVKRSKREL